MKDLKVLALVLVASLALAGCEEKIKSTIQNILIPLKKN